MTLQNTAAAAPKNTVTPADLDSKSQDHNEVTAGQNQQGNTETTLTAITKLPPETTTQPATTPHQTQAMLTTSRMSLSEKIRYVEKHRKQVMHQAAAEITLNRFESLKTYKKETVTHNKMLTGALIASSLSVLAIKTYGHLYGQPDWYANIKQQIEQTYGEQAAELIHHSERFMLIGFMLLTSFTKRYRENKPRELMDEISQLNRVDFSQVKAWLNKEEQSLAHITKQHFSGLAFEALSVEQVDRYITAERLQSGRRGKTYFKDSVSALFKLDHVILKHILESSCGLNLKETPIESLTAEQKTEALVAFRRSMAKEIHAFLQDNPPPKVIKKELEMRNRAIPQQLETIIAITDTLKRETIDTESLDDDTAETLEMLNPRTGPKIKTRPAIPMITRGNSARSHSAEAPDVSVEQSLTRDGCYTITFTPPRELGTPNGGEISVSTIKIHTKLFKGKDLLLDKISTLLADADAIYHEGGKGRQGLQFFSGKDADQLHFKCKVLGAHGDERLWSSKPLNNGTMVFDRLGDHQKYQQFKQQIR